MAFKYDWPLAFEKSWAGERRMLDLHIAKVYQELLLPLAISKTHSMEMAEDVCSDVITKFWKKFHKNRDPLPENVNAYLNTMTQHSVFYFFNMKKKKSSLVEYMDDESLRLLVEKDISSNHEFHSGMSDEELKLKQILSRAFHSIGETCRELLRLNVIEKERISRIWSKLGFSTPNAATQRKVACLKKMRKLMFQDYQNLKGL